MANVGRGAISSKFRIDGVKEVQAKLRVVEKDTRVRIIKAIKEEGNKIIARAKELTPVDTGRLQESGRLLTFGTVTSKNPQLFLVFGGKKMRGIFVDYAGFVHETHKSMSKFLDKAIKEAAPGFATRIAAKAQVRF